MNGIPWLHERKEWRGQWWIPDEPKETRAGVLTYTPEEGVRLSLIGGFERRRLEEIEPGQWAAVEVERSWDVVHGLACNRPVTLLGCVPIHTQSYFLGEAAEQTISADGALVGYHLNADEQPFVGVEVSIERLTHWSAESPVAASIRIEDGAADGTAKITVDPLDSRVAQVPGFTATLNHVHTFPFIESQHGRDSYRVTHSATVRFEAEEPVPRATLVDSAMALRDLVTLSTYRPCGVLWQQFLLPTEDSPDGRSRPPKVDWYGKQTARPMGPDEVIEGRHQDLLTLEDASFETLIPRWFEVRDRFRAAVNLVLGLLYSPNIYVELQVLTTVGAAEAFHRALDPDPAIPQERFDALRSQLMECLDKADRSWLSDQLGRNEPTLKARLLDLSRRPDAEVMERILADPDRWAKTAKDARNLLAHEGQPGGHAINVLYAVARVTATVVVLNLLHELDVPVERLRQDAEYHPALQQAGKLSRTYLSTGSPSQPVT